MQTLLEALDTGLIPVSFLLASAVLLMQVF